MQKIYLRADASAAIGYGHFIRTLALADMLKDDFDCTFFTCHPTPYQVSEMEKVCPFIPLQEESHYDEFLSLLQGDEIVVLDNYFFTTDYQRTIKEKGCCLVCVDDMHDKHYVADVVINHGLTDESLFDVEPYTKLCLGGDWALLRHPFIEAVKEQRCHTIGSIEKVTITFGGCDDFDATGYYASNLLESKNVKSITAVVGDAYKPIHPISQDRRLTYCSGLSAEQMADLFRHLLLFEVFLLVVVLQRDPLQVMKTVIIGGGIGPGSYYVWIYIQFALLLPIIALIIKLLNKVVGGVKYAC